MIAVVCFVAGALMGATVYAVLSDRPRVVSTTPTTQYILTEWGAWHDRVVGVFTTEADVRAVLNDVRYGAKPHHRITTVVGGRVTAEYNVTHQTDLTAPLF
jgi:hypothetical protein